MNTNMFIKCRGLKFLLKTLPFNSPGRALPIRQILLIIITLNIHWTLSGLRFIDPGHSRAYCTKEYIILISLHHNNVFHEGFQRLYTFHVHKSIDMHIAVIFTNK